MSIRTEDVIEFSNRREAGRLLAEELCEYAGCDDVIVLGLPRGGVPVAYEVALALQSPLDVFVVRKLGVPGCEELAMGAIASGGARIINESVLAQVPNANEALRLAIEAELTELKRREAEYRGAAPPLDLTDKIVIVVDDGLATGATMRSAAMALRSQKIARLVVATPVGAQDACARLRTEVDDVVCLAAPLDFRAVGQFYETFCQTTDREVRNLLADAAQRMPAKSANR